MGKVTLDEKFKSYTGALPPNGHRFYLTNRYGETIISHCPKHRDPSTISEKQKASNALLNQARTLADADLADEAKHAEWVRRRNADYESWKRYKTLRGYVIAHFHHQLTQHK